MHVRGQLADGEVQLVEREVHRVEGVGGGEDLEEALLLLLELLEQVSPQLVQPASGTGEVTLPVWLGCVTSIVVELGASGFSGGGSRARFMLPGTPIIGIGRSLARRGHRARRQRVGPGAGCML